MDKQRTKLQNRSIHKLFRMLSEMLNEKGLDARIILKPTYEIWWTPEMIKRDLWKPLQKAMLSKESTTELSTNEVSKVFVQLMEILGKNHGAEAEFPSQQETINYVKSLEESYGKEKKQ